MLIFEQKEDIVVEASDISDWISEQVENANARGAVFGLSGGLDSSVVGALLRMALGEKCLGLIMPCYNAKADLEDARKIASLFDIPVEEVNLERIFDSFLTVLPEISEIAKANIKPRIRMATLYAFANDRGYLVVGTGNKSELSVGYFTKYGDGGADILPIGNIYKTDLIPLARELGTPVNVIEKPPSAGLWDGQTDEAEMGMTYSELDYVLKALERGVEPDVSFELVGKVRTMIEKSAHKRIAARIPDF